MKTAYIRHNFNADEKTLRHLWNEHFIALHYKDIPSTNPSDYSGAGKNTYRRLHDFCDAGVLIGATYSEIEPSKILVGQIEIGSEFKPIKIQNIWYKVVKISEVKEISFVDYPILAALQPRQGTLTGWPSAEKILNSIYFNKKLDFSVYSLSPAQLEILCYEYLRSKGIVKSLLLPIGRSLPHIDIFGITPSNKNIIAQVTFTKNLDELKTKFELLRKYKHDQKSNKAILIFFGRDEYKINDNEIKYLSIEKIFASLKNNAAYNHVLKRMINR